MYYIYADFKVNDESYDIKEIYSPERLSEGYAAYNMKLDKELNRAGSFSFTIAKSHPLYNDITQLGTTVYVKKNGECIWAGRVLNISRDMYLNKNIQCEGALAFLGDIIIRPFKYYGVDPKVSLKEHFSTIMGKYNQRCSPKRYLEWADEDLPEDFTNSEIYSVSGVDSYVSVLDEINSIRTKDESLALTMDYIFGGKLYVRLVKLPYRTVDSYIEFGVNMLDYAEETDGTGVYSAVIPVTDGKITIEGYEDQTENSGLANKYGVIEKAVNFDNVSSGAALGNACSMMLSKVEAMTYPSLNIKAVDLYHLGVGLASYPIDVGYAVPVRSLAHNADGYYLCTKVSIDIDNIENSSYTFDHIGGSISRKAMRRAAAASSSSCFPYGQTELTDAVISSKKKIQKYELRDRPIPDKIERSSNKVTVHYPDYKVEYEAEGVGKERHNFKMTVVNTEESGG